MAIGARLTFRTIPLEPTPKLHPDADPKETLSPGAKTPPSVAWRLGEDPRLRNDPVLNSRGQIEVLWVKPGWPSAVLSESFSLPDCWDGRMKPRYFGAGKQRQGIVSNRNRRSRGTNRRRYAAEALLGSGLKCLGAIDVLMLGISIPRIGLFPWQHTRSSKLSSNARSIPRVLRTSQGFYLGRNMDGQKNAN